MATPEQMNKYYSAAPQPPAPLEEPATDEQREAHDDAMAEYEQLRDEYEEEHGPPPEPDPVVPPPMPPMPAGGGAPGFPAARIGDMTAHGGTIVAGDPNTIINGMPAARVTDMHTCPMVTGIVPHVGGPVIPPGAATVIISGMPAARVTAQCTCVGPPDVIAKGEPTVLIG